MTVSHVRAGDILVVTVDYPPVNALAQTVRLGLIRAINEAVADPAVAAIVIRCAGRTFSVGADIAEFGEPPRDPSLPDVCAAPKPVVAAVYGTALGGGLEIAMACHYRIADSETKLGFPEVTLGLVPGAGGTQRLPRLVSTEAAVEIILSGTPVSATRALEIGLVDRLTDGELSEAAFKFAQEIRSLRPLPRVSRREVAIDKAAIERYRGTNARRRHGLDAPDACLEAITAAALPFVQGAAKERELFVKLMAGVQSRALRYLFFAERAAAKIDGFTESTSPFPIRTVGIIGAGMMGRGIAMNFLSAGIPVTIVERADDALKRGVEMIKDHYATASVNGRISQVEVDAAMAQLTPSIDLKAVGDCDLVIEAVFEDMVEKKALFLELDGFVRQGAILATNTSYLDVDEIARSTLRPEWVVGLHFFSPANVMKLLEVVRGARTSDRVLLTAVNAARLIGKIAVVAGVTYGFIGNRILRARQQEANKLILEGVTPSEVDAALTEFGLPMGPFEMIDLAGVDIGWHRDPRRRDSVREILCAERRWGQKSKAGFYDYDDQRNRTPSPHVENIIRSFARARGIQQRMITVDEILERCLYPMINEGKAQRVSDIDVVWVNGYGWPRWRGGPMFWADEIGLRRVVEKLGYCRHRLGPEFVFSPLLIELAARGATFKDARQLTEVVVARN
jgi:3-hydroxyacyl-CoA dehydrogenase